MAKLNVEKILNTDFTDRFLGFVEKYESIRSIQLLSTAKKWVENEDFDSIKYFLHVTPVECYIPCTMHEFIFMDISYFEVFQNICTEISALLDEKKYLYHELTSFYE